MRSLLILAAVATAVPLMGCVSPEQLAERDDATCAAYGAPAGSPNYARCRLTIAQLRQQQQAMALYGMGAAMRSASQGVASAPVPVTATCSRMGTFTTCTAN